MGAMTNGKCTEVLPQEVQDPRYRPPPVNESYEQVLPIENGYPGAAGTSGPPTCSAHQVRYDVHTGGAAASAAMSSRSSS